MRREFTVTIYTIGSEEVNVNADKIQELIMDFYKDYMVDVSEVNLR